MVNRSAVRRAATAAGLACLGAAVPAAAQTIPYAAGAGAAYEFYTFLDPASGIERLSLVSVPFAAGIRPTGRVRLELSGAFARGSLARTDGSSSSLSGLTDAELRASTTLADDRVTVALGALLPTGQATQSLDQLEVAGAIASDLLPFRVSNWGSGGALAIRTALAVPVRGFGVGVSAGYTLAREFRPLEGDDMRYRPGNELRLRVAVDRTLNRTVKASVLLGMQRYAEDAVAGEAVYRPGNRVEALGTVSFGVSRSASAVAYLGVQHRGQGSFFLEDLEAPARDLILAGTTMRVLVGQAVLLPAVDARVFRRSDGVGQGYLAGLGVSAEWPAGQVTLVPTLRTRFGKVLFWEGEEGYVRGGEVGVAVRFGGLRP